MHTNVSEINAVRTAQQGRRTDLSIIGFRHTESNTLEISMVLKLIFIQLICFLFYFLLGLTFRDWFYWPEIRFSASVWPQSQRSMSCRSHCQDCRVARSYSLCCPRFRESPFKPKHGHNSTVLEYTNNIWYLQKLSNSTYLQNYGKKTPFITN